MESEEAPRAEVDENGNLRAQVLRTGFAREGDPGLPDPTFVPNAITEMRRHWIDPALVSRTHDEPRQALVIFRGDGSTEVRINDEVEYLALVGEDDKLVAPDGIFVGQVTSIWPAEVDPDLAWTGYATASGGRIVVCDFRRNRERVTTLLARANEYSRSAELSLANGLVAPALEDLHTAAELAVMVLIQLEGWDDRRNHKNRQTWLTQSVEFSGVPAAFGDAFTVLAAERNAARYNERPLAIGQPEVAGLRLTVGQMIHYAEALRA